MASSPLEFTTTFQNAFADMQSRAKAAYEKSTGVFGEANEFAKGNVEALVESGKILASGLQELGATVVADTRSAFETMTGETRELAAAKSPTDFFQLQSAMLRRHFDGVIALASKNTESMLKVANDAMSPISNRIAVAVEKVAKVG